MKFTISHVTFEYISVNGQMTRRSFLEETELDTKTSTQLKLHIRHYTTIDTLSSVKLCLS